MPAAPNALALATQNLAAGNPAGAEHHARLALQAEPHQVAGQTILGIALDRQGKRRDAVVCFRRAVQLLPHMAETHYNLGNCLKNDGQAAEAVRSYQQALRLKPNHIQALNNLGIVHKDQGEFDQAIVYYRQALALDANFANTHNNLGDALNKLGRRPEAIHAFQAALLLEPGRADFVYNLAVCLHEHGELDQAVSQYRRALRLKPDMADALNNLGKAFKEQGLLEEAIAQFRHTLRLEPLHAFALYNLSELAGTGHYRFPPEQIASLKSCVAAGHGSPAERSLFSFTLATVLQRAGANDEAFAHYRTANDLRRSLLQERKQAFDAEKHEALARRITHTFDRSYFQQTAGWGLDTESPVFIVGMPRSGSTLVEQILASHPQVFGAGECGHISRLITELASQSRTELHERATLPDRQQAQALAHEYHQVMARLGKGASVVTDKTLDNFLHLGVIATLFPRARIIHCQREPLDACLSCYFQNFQDQSFSWSLQDIGVYYKAYERLMAHWSAVLPLPIHEVRYEELIHDQEGVTRRLLAFLGLSWDSHCLTFFNTRRTVRTASAVQVRKPVSPYAIGRWRHYRAHLGPLLEALGIPASADRGIAAESRRSLGLPAGNLAPHGEGAGHSSPGNVRF